MKPMKPAEMISQLQAVNRSLESRIVELMDENERLSRVAQLAAKKLSVYENSYSSLEAILWGAQAFTDARLAKLAGISRSTASRLLHGRQARINVKTIRKVARVLKTTPDELIKLLATRGNFNKNPK